jgi:hypothetical protein
MSLESTLRKRVTRWQEILTNHGYAMQAPRRGATASGEICLRARRPTIYGGPPVMIDINEIWISGEDPDQLDLRENGCYLFYSSWHAQVDGDDATRAERLDVDRRKPAGLIVHRHPYGEPNPIKLPAKPLAAPEAWMTQVERLIYDLTLKEEDEADEVDEADKSATL